MGWYCCCSPTSSLAAPIPLISRSLRKLYVRVYALAGPQVVDGEMAIFQSQRANAAGIIAALPLEEPRCAHVVALDPPSRRVRVAWRILSRDVLVNVGGVLDPADRT